MQMPSFLLDGLLAGLLFATIIYAAILDRRLRTFRQAREDMQALLSHFTAATVQAQSGIAALRDASETTSLELKDQLEQGKALREDLAFLIDRGASLADRLEGGISAARANAKTADVQSKPAVKLAEAARRQAGAERVGEGRISETRAADLHVAEPRFGEKRASEPRGGDKTDAARDFLRALRAAR